jgi:hypothetical protein
MISNSVAFHPKIYLISDRTFSGLNGNNPLPLYAAKMFLLVSKLTLAGLYR